jgi:hypothetical protein
MRWKPLKHILILINYFPLVKYLLSDQASFHFEFGILTAVTTRSTMFWDVTPCNLVEVNRCLRGTYCLCLQGRRISRENEPARNKDQQWCYFTVWSCQSPAQSPNWEDTHFRLSVNVYLIFDWTQSQSQRYFTTGGLPPISSSWWQPLQTQTTNFFFNWTLAVIVLMLHPL